MKIKLISFLLAIFFISLRIFANEIQLAPDVREEMLSPSFWIQKYKEPYKTIMTKEEILKFNKNCASSYVFNKKTYKVRVNLLEEDEFIMSDELQYRMSVYSDKVTWFYKDKNGKSIQLSEKDWKKICDESNFSLIGNFKNYKTKVDEKQNKLVKSVKQKKLPVKRGICVRRSNLKLIPRDTIYSVKPNYWYDDMNQVSSIHINDPVVIMNESSNGKWYFVKTFYTHGWVHKEDIALCTKEEFQRYFNYGSEENSNFITITTERFQISENAIIKKENIEEKIAIPELYMGTRLHIKKWNKEFNSYFAPRIPHACYIAELPFKKKDGTLGIFDVLISAGKCTKGFLTFNVANILTLAFQALGNSYGWGGMNYERDCSGFSFEIYRCFGFDFESYSGSQAYMPGKTIDFVGKSNQTKLKLLKECYPGSILFQKGHIFLFLGFEKEVPYTISAAGIYTKNENDKKIDIDAESVHINSLYLEKNGKTWLERLEKGKLLY